MPRTKTIDSISGNKSRILLFGKPGETHTLDYTLDDTLKNLAINSKVLKEVTKLVKNDELLILSKGRNGKLQVCRIVDMARVKI